MLLTLSTCALPEACLQRAEGTGILTTAVRRLTATSGSALGASCILDLFLVLSPLLNSIRLSLLSGRRTSSWIQ